MENKEKKPRSKKKIIIGIVIAVVVLFVLFMLIGSSDSALDDAKSMDKGEFMKSCKEYKYDDLTRNADDYYDKAIKISLRAGNEFEENNFDSYTGDFKENPENWYDDNILLNNCSDTKIVEDDVIDVYGIYKGKAEVETVLGQKLEVPEIEAVYVEPNQFKAEIDKLVKTIDFKLVEDEYGYREYKGTLENTSDITFKDFSIEISLLNKEGTVIETTSAYAENWAPGEKTVFSFSTDNKVDKIKVKDWEYY